MTKTINLKIQLPLKPHINQIPLLNSPARFNVVAAGRRFGKTEVFKLRAIKRAMTGRVWWVMPTYEGGQRLWRDMAQLFAPIPHAYINHSERLVQFSSKAFFQVKTGASKENLRGAGLDYAVLDEAAFLDPEIWSYVIRPMLLDSNGCADFSSSTNGRNWFWQLYQQGLDETQSDWKSWHFTSYDNPLLDRNEIDDIRRNTPERVFQQEYMAEFLDDGGAVFRNLKACIDDSETTAEGRVVFGVDWGKSNDYTVIVAIDSVTKRVLEIDRFHQIDWTLQRGRLQTMAQRWYPSAIFAESNSIGEPNIEELHKSGLPVRGFQTTASSKQQIINALALAFEQADIRIPNHSVLLGELQAYTLERLPGGTFRYSAPSGMHDDCVMALALAWHGVARQYSAWLLTS